MTTTAEFDKVGSWAAWCDMFLAAPTEPMTKEQTNVFMTVLLMEKEASPIPPDLNEDFFFQVATKRAEFIGLKITPYTVAMICMLSGSVGDVVMFITAMARYAQLNGNCEVTTNELAHAFPMGFPTKDTKHILWDSQKGFAMEQKFDNLIDRVSKEDF